MEENKNKSSMGIAAFVLGIVSIVTALFWYMTLPTGVLAIVFGAKAAKKIGSKLGKSGLIMGIVGLSIFAFVYLTMILLMVVGEYI